MILTQPRQLGQRRERNIVGDMLLDIGGHPLLLPARKAATTDRLLGIRVTVDSNELMRQHDAERFGVLPMHRVRVLDHRLELESGLPEVAIVEEQARLEFDILKPERGIGERPTRIDVEVGCTRQYARPLPSAEVVPGGNESQLVREIAQGRPRQAFNEGLPIVALGDFCRNEQVPWSPKSVFKLRVPHDLDRLPAKARPGRGTALGDLRRGNIDERTRFKMRLRPCRRMLGDLTCERWKGSGLIQGRFGGTGHYSISLTSIRVQPQTLLVGRSRR